MTKKQHNAHPMILIAAFFLLATVGLSAQGYKLPHKGYSGDVGFSVGIKKSELDVTPTLAIFTTHGYNFTPRFYMGGGVAFIQEVRYLAVYGQMMGVLSKIKPTRSHYPFLSLNAGYVWSTWSGDHFGDENGLYVEPRFGWSFYSTAGNLRYDVFIGAAIYSLSITPSIGIAFRL